MQLTHDEQIHCVLGAIEMMKQSGKLQDNDQRYQKDIGIFEYIVEGAEAIGSEWVVAKYFDLPFDPYENKYKVKADVGNAIEAQVDKVQRGANDYSRIRPSN